ncbi:cation diffusion facilitator family transporter [Apibacter mensalis]|uniref:Cation diffusion facilitator family transporter n=1 Tax=Apibacter mensalis TaxID=1586267 RepID=A0A0X3AMY8_9FLAO|nr:cation diffusion facilitator family transporter [Apibacter mensalis]CVK15507.1 cation diffusion facilitator family transporter [Apibacter mensalis]
MNTPAKENYFFQKIVVIVGTALFIIKVIAWQLTQSIAILTDTLESIINVAAGLFSLYSLYISSKPKDRDHPYGHGKIEFISAGIEGSLITVAGISIIYESVIGIFNVHEIKKLDSGILLIAIAGFINYILGVTAIRKGKKNKSLALISGGEHLKSDTYSTIGLVLGLWVIYFFKIYWLDSLIALIFAMIIIYTGLKIIRRSLAGIMDEADEELIVQLVETLNKNRNPNWIDIHNVRFIKYGSSLHLDCHLTLPWYFNVREAHQELDKLKKVIIDNFGNSFEMFVHVDDCCETISCKICKKANCPYRKYLFDKEILWTKENIEMDNRHNLDK